MKQSDINKNFFSAFNIYHFNEADFNKEAFEEKMEEHRRLVNKYLAEFKVYLDGTESLIKDLPPVDESVKLNNQYIKMVNMFAILEIEINKIWS
jgi:phosphoenolpyruvate carboxylase